MTSGDLRFTLAIDVETLRFRNFRNLYPVDRVSEWLTTAPIARKRLDGERHELLRVDSANVELN